MVTNGLTYEQARDFYAEFLHTSPEQAQAALCYATLRAGFDGMPGEILTALAEEVKHENGVFASTGSGPCAGGLDACESLGDENGSAYWSPDK